MANEDTRTAGPAMSFLDISTDQAAYAAGRQDALAALRAEYDLVPKGSALLWRDLARRADGGDPGAAMQLVGAVLAALEDLG
jgi:uncharacterized protein YfiM (DUF2279 family)